MTIFSATERIKRLLGWIWVAVIVATLLYIAFHPQFLSVEYLAALIKKQEAYIWPIYIFLLLIRCFVMLPATPFLLLGLVLFPGAELLVVLLVMMSILISAAFFYYFANRMGWHHFFRKRYPKQMATIETRLQQPRAIWLIILWSFLPIFPTDLLCYAAGIVAMPFRILIIGVIIGQLPLLLIYAYLGTLFF